MINIMFNKRLSSQDGCKRFFAIPVKMIKVMMSYSFKPELNHFERAVLSLFMHKYYSLSELSDMLLLKKELIELIICNLKTNQFINVNNELTLKGEEAIKNILKKYKDEVCYVLYDLNRKCLLSDYCKSTDLIITQGTNEYFRLENDAFNEDISYKLLKIENKKNNYHEKMIIDSIKKDIFRSKDKNLVSVKILGIDTNTYNLISYVETNENVKDSKWSVINPISLEHDESLYDLFYRSTDNKTVKQLILDVMQFRKNAVITDEVEKELYYKIKNKLFKQEIKDIHEIFIIPLMSIVRIINNTSETSYNEKVTRINAIKEAMIELGDLFEKIIFQAALDSASEYRTHYEFILGKDRANNKIILGDIAKTIGFDISDNGIRLLNVDKKSINRIIKKPDQAQLSECLAWSLSIALANKNFYLLRLAKKYPDFINLMYKFKRDVRDKNKHTTLVELITPQIYMDIMWDLFEMAFGYIVNKNSLDEILRTNNTICDYSYSAEYIRSRVGNKVFDSNTEQLARFKLSLITMYDSYLTEQCSFIQPAYSLVDECITLLATSLKRIYKIGYKSIGKLFTDSNEIVNYLESLGFNIETHKVFGNDLAGSIDFVGQEYNVQKGFESNFKDAVLRIKVLAIIIMLKICPDITKEFIDYKDIFITTSTISFVQRHQQNHVFNNKQAQIIVEEVLKLTDFLINKTNINWR